MGGLARLKTTVDELTQVYGKENSLFINTGNNFKKTLQKDQYIVEKGKARMMFRSFEMMGLEVAGPGKNDFIFGPEFLADKHLQKSSQWVCANLVKISDASLFFAPHLLIEKGGKKVLITGVLDPDRLDLSCQGLRVTDPISSLVEVQKNVPHDLFIAILQTTVSSAEKWVRAVPGIHVALLGEPDGVSYKNNMVNNTRLVYNNRKGQVISHVDISFEKHAGVVEISPPNNIVIKAKETLQDEKVKMLIHDYERWAFKQKRKEKTKTGHGRQTSRSSQ